MRKFIRHLSAGLLSLLLAFPAAAEIQSLHPVTPDADLYTEIRTLTQTTEDLKAQIRELKEQTRILIEQNEAITAQLELLTDPRTTVPPVTSPAVTDTEESEDSFMSEDSGSTWGFLLIFLALLLLIGIAVISAVLIRTARTDTQSAPFPKEKFKKQRSHAKDLPSAAEIPTGTQSCTNPPNTFLSSVINDFSGTSAHEVPERPKTPPAVTNNSVPSSVPSPAPQNELNTLFIQAAGGTSNAAQLNNCCIRCCIPNQTALAEVRQKAAIPENQQAFRSYQLICKNQASSSAPFLVVNDAFLYPNFPMNAQRIPTLWNTLESCAIHHIFRFEKENGESLSITSARRMRLVGIVPAEVNINSGTQTASVTRCGTLIFR